MFRIIVRKIVVGLAALAGLQALPAAAQSDPMIGQMMCGAFNFAPRGWAEMNGDLLPISENDALFSLLGTTYGGDGQTTFALPDTRGRAVLGTGAGPGLQNRTLGEAGGSEAVTLTVANLPQHTHPFAPLGSNNDATSISPAGKVPAAKARTTLYTEPSNTVTQAGGNTGVTGGGQAVANAQPYLTVKCFIALYGIYPSHN